MMACATEEASGFVRVGARPAPGTLLKYNSLGRLGHHYDWKAFCVDDVTEKGNIMGYYVPVLREAIMSGQDSHTDRWVIPRWEHIPRTMRPRRRRLAKPLQWEYMTAEERAWGIVSTSVSA